MATAIINAVGQLAGKVITGTVERTADGGKSHEIPLWPGSAGTLGARTDDDTGGVTLESGHGLQDNDTVDVYWSGGMRYGMDAQVAGDTIDIDGGTGDALPTDTPPTDVVLTKQVQITSDFDGDDLQAIVIGCDQRAHLDFQTAAPASLAAVEVAAGGIWDWAAGQAIANPLTGDAVADIYASSDWTGLGSELIVNGDFATEDLTGWDSAVSGQGVISYSSGRALLDVVGTGSCTLSNAASIPLVVGETYILSVDVTETDSVDVDIPSEGVDETWQGAAPASHNSYRVSFVASNATIAANALTFYIASATGESVQVDNISLRLRPADEAILKVGMISDSTP